MLGGKALADSRPEVQGIFTRDDATGRQKERQAVARIAAGSRSAGNLRKRGRVPG